MPEQANVETVRRLMAVYDSQDLAPLAELTTDDFRGHFSGVPAPLEREPLKQFFGVFYAAFPDISHAIEDIFASGDRVVARLRITGTQRGELMGIPASGRRIDFTSLNLFAIRDGRVAEQWIESDQMAMMQQIGALGEPASASA